MTTPEYTPGFWLPLCDAKDYITSAMSRGRMYAVTREGWHLFLHFVVTAATDPGHRSPGRYITGYNGTQDSDMLPLTDEYALTTGKKALEFLELYGEQRPQPRHWYHYGP